MQQALEILTFPTSGPGLYEITAEVAEWLRGTGLDTGLLTLFCRHTSAGLMLTENVSPAVWRDWQTWLSGAVPESNRYEHSAEGSDDMPAHIKTVLTGSSVQVPVSDGQMLLGTWQGIFLAEHRRDPHSRSVVMHAIGE